MAIAYVNKGTFASGNNAISPGIPSGYTVGNFLLLLVESANETITAPSDWNEYTQTGVGTAAAAGGVRLGIFWRIATSGQAAPSVADTGNHTTGIIFEFSGVEPGAPFATSAYTTPNTSTFSFSNLACAYSQPFILLALANDVDTASTSNLASWSTGLTSFAQRHDQTVSTGVGGGIGLATGIANVSAGNAIGVSQVTNRSAVNVIAYTIELRPKIPLASTISTGTTKSADLKKRGLHSIISSGSVPFFGVKYGCIYNWYAVVDSRQLAPSGWHVSSKYDFETLNLYLDPNAAAQDNISAPPLTEPVTYWIAGENIATNTAKFNARGLSGRGQYGFNALGGEGHWWNTDEWSSTHACFSFIIRNDPELITYGFGINWTNPKWQGRGVRLVKDSTTLSHGQSGFMTGNDGKVYRTICIGTQEWLADNLCESKFRNGEEIPGGTMSDATWYGLTTAGVCFPNNDSSIAYGTYLPFPYVLGALKGTGALALNLLSGQPLRLSIVYGNLYNWYAATDARNIAPSGWHVATLADFYALRVYLHPGSLYNNNDAGGPMKATGFTWWNSPNTDASNSSGFNARGSGIKTTPYSLLLQRAQFWNADQQDATNAYISYLLYNDNTFYSSSNAGGGDYGFIADYKSNGNSIRLVKDDSNDPGIMLGNDGKIYRTIKIGNQVWLADNLAETKFRNGDSLTYVYDINWFGRTLEAYCIYDLTESNSYTYSAGDSLLGLLKGKGSILSTISSGNNFVTGGYGFLYNCYVVRNTANIANTGWHVPSRAELQALATYLGGESVAGGKLKETGYDHWSSPNTGATNETGFNLRGGALRDPSNGTFALLKSQCNLWTSTDYFTTYGTVMTSAYNTEQFYYSGGGTHLRSGCSIRLIKDSTSLQNGETGSYTGNDGKTYSTICINGVEYLSHNLIETKYRDGSSIPEVTSNSEWIALTTHAFCAHSNDWANAYFSGFMDGVIGTIEFSGQAASLIATILSESGITASITGKGKLLANADGSTTLLAQIEGGSFIPIITFF